MTSWFICFCFYFCSLRNRKPINRLCWFWLDFWIVCLVCLCMNSHFWTSIICFVFLLKLLIVQRLNLWETFLIFLFGKLTLKCRFFLAYFETIHLLVKSLSMNFRILIWMEYTMGFLFYFCFEVWISGTVGIPFICEMRVADSSWTSIYKVNYYPKEAKGVVPRYIYR